MKYILVFILAFAFVGCSQKEPEPIVVTKYKILKEECYIPQDLLIKESKIKVPELSNELNDKDLRLIQSYVFDLYKSKQKCNLKIKTIKNLFNAGDNNVKK